MKVACLVGELEQVEPTLRLFSDFRAALAIINGSSGSWRTRHLRIRAHAVTEATKQHRLGIQHLPGEHLVADGFMKNVGNVLFRRLKETMGMREESGSWRCQQEAVEEPRMRKMHGDEMGGLQKAVILLVTCGGCLQGMDAADVTGGIESDVMLLLFFLAVLTVLQLVKTAGQSILAWRREEASVKFKKVKEAMAGYKIFANEEVVVPAGGYTLVRIGVGVDIPAGSMER